MPVIRFQDWTPDAAELGNPGSVSVKNVYPGLTAFKPVGALSANTQSTQERVLGAVSALNKSLISFQYAGDASRLYLQSSQHWDDVSKSGGYATADGEAWEFAQWENKILATNFSNDPQQITMAIGNVFSDLVTSFTARHVAVIGDFVVFGNINDDVDGEVPWRIKWSASNDETDWTVSPVTLSSQRELETGDSINRILGGEFGIILTQNATWRMTFIGSPLVFQLDEVLPGIGVLSGGAATLLGGIAFYLSEHGFIALSGGTTPAFIGSGKVDRFVLSDLDTSNLGRISSAAEPQTGRVAWAYPGSGNTGGLPNKIIIYDRTLNKWSLIEENVTLLWRSLGVSLTLEDLDSISTSLDDLPQSLDSAAWKATGFALSAFDLVPASAASNHVLLVPLDGKDAAVAASDFSASAHTLTFNGDAQLDVDQKKFGQSSLLLDGTGDFLSWPDSVDFSFDGQFTIHGQIRPNAAAASQAIVGQWDESGNQRSWIVELTADEKLQARISTDGTAVAGTITAASAVATASDFIHFALTRDGAGEVRLFQDGTEIGTSVNETGALHDSTAAPAIGSEHGGAAVSPYSGHIDQIEILKGEAKWTSNFTAPEAPTPNPGGSRSGTFEGATMTAEIETKEMELTSGRKTHLNAFRPVVDGGSVTARVAARDRQTDTATFSEVLTQSASGRFTKRSNGRYHKFKVEISGPWNDAIGVQVEQNEARPGERRG